MRNVIVGTAGHIDHGKTALVRALTGIDTDRLKEEKRRGISIELGFAHLQLSRDLRLGFVDVPGHERFVRTMLAGAAGIDMVLLVVAADESIKPQTREHFDICRLLGVSSGVVALTKADLADEELLELVRLEVREFVRGSFLESAPVVAVSARTGEGLEELKQHLKEVASRVAQKDASRHFRLPVDRSFVMKGFGRVVTGTLVSGAVRVEEEVEIQPLGETVRVRGIQVHGEAASRAVAGQRTALNLAGPAADRVARGMTLTKPGLFQPTQTVEARFHLLAGARPLKHKAPVHFHAGTAEVIAEARLLESEAVEPGASALVRFLLREPVLLLPADRFIVRMFSPVVTIGGGEVLETAPPPRIRRAEAARRLRALESGSRADRVALLVAEAEYGLGVDSLVGRTGLLPEEIRGAAAESGRVLLFEESVPWLVDRDRYAAHAAKVRAALREHHRAHPLKPGMVKEELRSRELPGAPAFYLDAILAREQDLVAEGDTVRLASHKIRLRGDEEEALRKIESAFRRAGLAVPAVKEVLARSGVDQVRARNLLQVLLREGKLVRVGDELVYHETAIRDLLALMARRRGERFKVPEFKEWTGVSRKYAIPLLEYLDRRRITRREGDERVVL